MATPIVTTAIKQRQTRSAARRCGGPGGLAGRWCRCRRIACLGVSVVGLMERPAAALWVDPKVHAAEVARFRSNIVAGPRDEDCSIWTGSIGADGYGRNYITPKGIGFCVRPN